MEQRTPDLDLLGRRAGTCDDGEILGSEARLRRGWISGLSYRRIEAERSRSLSSDGGARGVQIWFWRREWRTWARSCVLLRGCVGSPEHETDLDEAEEHRATSDRAVKVVEPPVEVRHRQFGCPDQIWVVMEWVVGSVTRITRCWAAREWRCNDGECRVDLQV